MHKQGEGTISRRGNCLPLGISYSNDYINFAIVADGADTCKLLIYDEKGNRPEYTYVMDKDCKTGSIFALQVKKSTVWGKQYLYEVNGKLLVDPYANSIVGREKFGIKSKKRIKGVVTIPHIEWNDNNRKRHCFDELILYKLHIRGFTKSLSSGVQFNGTYKGVAEKIPYLKELGINGVVLMPCTEFDEIIEPDSIYGDISAHGEEGKINYWGYGADNYYFAPKASYASAPENAAVELMEMINEFHMNDIEVIMEFCFEPEINILTIDECFRYWVCNYHIDGFRMMSDTVDIEGLAKDPYLRDTKLIAFGWNGQNSKQYDSRNLAECNDAYMTSVRRFIKGDEEQAGQFGYFFRRNPKEFAKINFVTDSNGFTLADLYSYDVKHNEANGEGNRDGTNYNYSWNCGMEGTTGKIKIKALRVLMMKNCLMSLLLSQGTPMLLAGDEFGNSQNGNNNSYCQDNAVTWLSWNGKKQTMLITSFIRQLIKLRKEYGLFSNRIENMDNEYMYRSCPDVSFHGTKAWYPDYSNYSRTLGILLTDFKKGDYFYIAFNMHWEAHDFDLPIPDDPRTEWEYVLSTASDREIEIAAGNRKFSALPRSITLWKAKKKIAASGKKEDKNERAYT